MKMSKTRLFSVILMFTMLFSTTSVFAERYDRWAASDYALKWYDGYNTRDYYQASQDCTNFVSQCLENGGFRRSSSLPSYDSVNHWRPHSATWESATYFRKFWMNRSRNYDYFAITSNNYNSLNRTGYDMLSVGDVVQYGYSSSDIRHSQIVHHFGNVNSVNTLKLAQHTGGRKDIALLDYLKSTSYTYVHFYNLPNDVDGVTGNSYKTNNEDLEDLIEVELNKVYSDDKEDYLNQLYQKKAELENILYNNDLMVENIADVENYYKEIHKDIAQLEKELGVYNYKNDINSLMDTIYTVVSEFKELEDIPEEVMEQSKERMEKLDDLYNTYEEMIQSSNYESEENLYSQLRTEFDDICERYR